MAEVRKSKKVSKYNIDEVKVDKKSKTKRKNNDLKKASKVNTNKNIEKKKSLWVRFRIFCHGVKTEFNKVFWPTKANMVKYSITTILFVLFLAIFFYIVDVLFALIQTLF